MGARGAIVLLAAFVSACAGDTAQPELSRVGYSCVDDSPECVSHRQTLLRQLQSDPSRGWMREQPSPESYASGVRLFAMKTKKHDLTCEELARGRQEAEQAPGALRSLGSRLTSAQVSRSQMLATEVGRELSNEFGRRCRRG